LMDNYVESASHGNSLLFGANPADIDDNIFRDLIDQMPQMVWSTLPDGYHDYYNRRWYEFTGVEYGSTDGDAWNGMFHPEDQPNCWAVWQGCLQSGEPYEVEYRLRHHSGAYRWTIGRAMPIRNGAGDIVRWIGTCTDIDEQKRLAERNEILSQELSHRIKNIFSVINALIGLSARDYPESRNFAKTLGERVTALGSAHDFVRPHSERSRPKSISPTLQGMMAQIFAAYPAYADGRMTIDGDDLPIDDRAATPMALVFHELATNAIKYGALKYGAGTVAIRITTHDDGVTIIWSEDGCTETVSEPESAGFGTRLIMMSITQQLGGTISKNWRKTGLQVEIGLPLKRLHR
jgi:PAS domain S-box-containing protein